MIFRLGTVRSYSRLLKYVVRMKGFKNGEMECFNRMCGEIAGGGGKT